jgi:misacylated tRNA(Ala) deacylase
MPISWPSRATPWLLTAPAFTPVAADNLQGIIHFDQGRITVPIASARMDADGIIWHNSTTPLPPVMPGSPAHLNLDIPRRLALMRYHTVLHILNTIALRDHQAWITGVQIDSRFSRIDFNFRSISTQLCRELEQKVNQVISAGHPLKSYFLSEEQFQQRPDLLRTLDVKPPIHNSQVRVVEINGFDAQACGGTHIHNTIEVGHFSILRSENKGRNNKRLYIQLDPPSG